MMERTLPGLAFALLLALGILFNLPGAGAAPVVSRGEEPVPVLPQARYWYDPDGSVDARSITSGLYDARFGPLPEHGLRALPGGQWLRFDLRNEQERSHLVLIVRSLMVAELELAYRDRDGFHDHLTGRNIGFAQRPIPVDIPALPLHIEPGATQTIYLRASPIIDWPLQPLITTELNLVEYVQARSWLLLLLAGVLIGVGLYIVVLATLSGEWRSVGWYTGIMVCSALILLARYGLLARFTDGNPYLQLSGLIPLASLERALTFQFIRSLFRTRERYPLIDHCCAVLIALALAFIPLHFVWDGATLIHWNLPQSFLTAIALIGISAYLTRRRDEQAPLFLTGIVIYLALQGIYNLVILQWLPYNDLTRYSLEAGTLVLALTYTLLLSDKLGRYRHENTRLETAAAVARAENRAKSELLAVMSHEIRTPLNGVLGMVELLLGTTLDSTQRLYVNTVQSSGKTLLTVINDILDFSKAEAGKMTLERRPFDLAELVEEVVAPYRAGASHNVALIASVAPDTPLRLVGDAIRLQQVIGNLLNNAFKFTDRGEVQLRIETLHIEPERVRLGCRVSDTGIGIDAASRGRLFQPFSQVDNSSSRRFGGTGLGLVICQRLVALMGGTIDVHSDPGRGSTFYFDVWLERDPAPAAPQEAPELTGKHLLAIDDRPEYLWILREQAQALGMTVDIVEQSAQALPAALRQRPDIIAIDLDMPQLDGFALEQQLAAAPELAGIPRILVTASCSPPPARDLRHSGFAAAYSKPSSVAQLRAILSAALGGRGARSAADDDITLPHFDGAVLVAEDNPVNRQVIETMLRRLGLTISVAANGAEALAEATARRFDLILMDCEMPTMDGYRATRLIRRHERAGGGAPVPIIALSAHAMAEYRQRSLDAGMNEHLPKPISLAALAEVLARHLPASAGKQILYRHTDRT